uniref:Protein SEC13 homolog n=1 Tax=Chrysotila carterae TaxID=13221 RepID=A0A7S4BU55_CHRCT
MQKVATAHEDLIHDAQLDYYGKRLATCSSDRTIKVYDVFEGGERKQVADLTGHDGPVWQVCWAHPKFGNILASCSYDRQILVWKEVGPGQWAVIYKYAKHAQSVNSIAWSPPEFGLRLACASSDGMISVLSHCADDTWAEHQFEAHKTGCNAVSWAPAFAAAAALSTQASPLKDMRLVSGGCDNHVKIWRCAAIVRAPCRDTRTDRTLEHAGVEKHALWQPPNRQRTE